jgi:FKBP-type peptidyl-prolyl cis-trans isomerase FkpA
VSVAEAAHRPVKSRRTAKLWLAFLLVIGAGIGLAWLGAQSVKDRVVQVATITPGSGPFVQAPDGVLIEYEGRLENGTVFDSSAGKGPVPLLASQVIPGFTQGLLKMQKGGRYKLRIPSDLAYGATPPQGGPIPPNANLEFDVNVVQVVPNAALMQGGGAPPGQ